jgi:hypothetical protein
MNTREDYVTAMDTREAILALAKDLRAYAQFEYDNRPDTAVIELQRRNRRDSLLFAAEYIEKSL